MKHEYITKPYNDLVNGTVAFTMDMPIGEIGVYEVYGPGASSGFLTKMKALRHLVRRKREILSSGPRVKLKGVHNETQLKMEV